MGYAINFFANVAISSPSGPIETQKNPFRFFKMISASYEETIPMPDYSGHIENSM
jgi:hypothetical protein